MFAILRDNDTVHYANIKKYTRAVLELDRLESAFKSKGTFRESNDVLHVGTNVPQQTLTSSYRIVKESN
jgi:hypothetical protein